MGQRHQLFIIASIAHRGSAVPRYRCVTAVHHQWLFGRTALEACKAFLTLVRAKENAVVIRAELTAIASEYTADQVFPAYPAPFLTWLIVLALTTRNDDQYTSNASILRPDIGSHGGDNNDGITVFDVTDPAYPKYCFVSIRGLEMANRHHVQRNVPLSAETYVRAYYPESLVDLFEDPEKKTRLRTQELEVQQAIDSFKREKLVQLWMLAEAWPGDKEHYEAMLIKEAFKIEEDGPLESPVIFGPRIPLSPPSVPSLSEISLRKVIAFADDSGDIAGLEIAISLPGLTGTRTLNMLAELEHFSNATFTILVNALSIDPDCEPGDLDLSRFSLTAEQVVEATAHFPGTQVLNLNGNRHIDGETILKFLPSLPKLSRLIVYDCPGISLSDIDRIYFAARHIHAIYHRALMIRSQELRTFYKYKGRDQIHPVSKSKSVPQFTFAMTNAIPSYSWRDKIVGCSIPWLSPRAIVIALNDFHDHLQWASTHDIEHNRPAEAFFSSLPRAPDVPFKERGIGNIPDETTLLADGGWAYVLNQESSEDSSFYMSEMAFHWGFVRYNFSRSCESNDIGEGTPALEEVEVMDLETWLKEVDPKQEVEKEWVARLQEKLVPSDQMSMITQEQARQLLVTKIPLF